jgi:O-antigen/teichoic acid export membrane protein
VALVSSSAESLTGRTTRAAQWRLAGSVIGVAFQFGFGVVLARLLTPRDFGVMALAVVVLGLARLLGDLGMGSAVVQRATLTERHVRTAFTVSVLVGIVTGALIVLMAPLGAAVMREPTLAPMLRVVSIVFVIGGMSTVAGALLTRNLDFKRQFFVDVGSYVLGYAGVATSLALLDYGVWSLVFGILAQVFLTTTAQIVLVRHSILPLLGGRELRDLLGFGVGATLSGFVNYLALNGDNFVVGRWIGAATLGLYNRAYTLMNMPFTYVASVMSGVLFPALAQVQHQPERMRRAYLLVTQLTALVAGPVMGVMALAAPAPRIDDLRTSMGRIDRSAADLVSCRLFPSALPPRWRSCTERGSCI